MELVKDAMASADKTEKKPIEKNGLRKKRIEKNGSRKGEKP